MRYLFFDTLNSSFYPITSIHPSIQRLIIRHVPPFTSPSFCITTNLHSQGIILNNSIPFNVSNSNTIMLLNCTSHLLLSPLNATIDDDVCCPLSICCTFIAGGSSTSYALWTSDFRCKTYHSFVNLDAMGMPVALMGGGWERERGRLGQWWTLDGARGGCGCCSGRRQCSWRWHCGVAVGKGRGEGHGDGEGVVWVGLGVDADVVATNNNVAGGGIGGRRPREREGKVEAAMKEDIVRRKGKKRKRK